jgi:hypothetical protein
MSVTLTRVQDLMLTVRPWKFSSTEKIKASFCGIPLTLYPHLRAIFTAVSTASAPVFMGKIMSNPNSLVAYSAKRGNTSL